MTLEARRASGRKAQQSVRIRLRLWSLTVLEIDPARFVPREVAVDSIEGGQRPVTAPPPFWGLAVCDLAGITGPAYVRKVRGCNR